MDNLLLVLLGLFGFVSVLVLASAVHWIYEKIKSVTHKKYFNYKI